MSVDLVHPACPIQLIFIVSPDCGNLAQVELIVVDLSKKDGCQGLIEYSAIHVDSGSTGSRNLVMGQSTPRPSSRHQKVIGRVAELGEESSGG